MTLGRDTEKEGDILTVHSYTVHPSPVGLTTKGINPFIWLANQCGTDRTVRCFTIGMTAGFLQTKNIRG